MNRALLVKEISEKAGLKRFTVRKVLDGFADVLFEALRDEKVKEVSLGKKLGKLVVKGQKARKARNPKTGESIEVPARKVVKFKMSRALKKALTELPF